MAHDQNMNNDSPTSLFPEKKKTEIFNSIIWWS